MDHFTLIRTRLLLCASAILSLTFSDASAVTRMVPGTYATIQEAVDAANSGDTVLVASGNYFGDGNRDINPGGKNLVIKSNSGSANCVLDCGGSEGSPHRAFLLENGESSATIIEGFTIDNGWGPFYNYVEGVDTIQVSVGGAIACLGTSPILKDLKLQYNTAYAGGAMICAFGANATIRDCEFNANTAYWFNESADGSGGGIFIFDAEPTITNCAFYDNTANHQGAAISCDELGTPYNIVIDSCLFYNNVGGSSGGAVASYGVSLQISNSVFYKNSTAYIGGALYFEDTPGTSEIANCTFVGNSCTGGFDSYGSVFFSETGGYTEFTRCLITGSSGGYTTLGCSLDATFSVSCTNIWGNPVGDWGDCISGMELVNNNFSANPYYCLTDSVDFHIDTNSPCAPANNACGLQIGAYGTACTNEIGCCVVAGDANFDNKVTIGDVTFLVSRVFLGGTAPNCCEEADANNSGTINIGDITWLIASIFTGGPAPECGPAGMSCASD